MTRRASSRGSTGSSSTSAAIGCRPPAAGLPTSRPPSHSRRAITPGRPTTTRPWRPRSPAVARPPGRRRPSLLPRHHHRGHRGMPGHPGGDRPVASPLRAQAAARGDRRRQRQGTPMNDDTLDRRLRALYHAEVPADLTAPPELPARVLDIPQASPARWSRSGFTLLAAAALLTAGIVGGSLLAGSGLVSHPCRRRRRHRPRRDRSSASQWTRRRRGSTRGRWPRSAGSHRHAAVRRQGPRRSAARRPPPGVRGAVRPGHRNMDDDRWA